MAAMSPTHGEVEEVETTMQWLVLVLQRVVLHWGAIIAKGNWQDVAPHPAPEQLGPRGRVV